ncbi:hypothetical protein V8F44DRAFT_569286 [Aspergillus fumigatus]
MKVFLMAAAFLSAGVVALGFGSGKSVGVQSCVKHGQPQGTWWCWLRQYLDSVVMSNTNRWGVDSLSLQDIELTGMGCGQNETVLTEIGCGQPDGMWLGLWYVLTEMDRQWIASNCAGLIVLLTLLGYGQNLDMNSVRRLRYIADRDGMWVGLLTEMVVDRVGYYKGPPVRHD